MSRAFNTRSSALAALGVIGTLVLAPAALGSSAMRATSEFPSGSFRGVKAISATDAWAVGYFNNIAKTALIGHWNGTAWTPVSSWTSRLSNFVELNAVDADSATDVWAVGQYTSGSQRHTLVERNTGSGWHRVAAPSPRVHHGHGAELNGVSVVSPDDVWAVGAYANSGTVLIEHWDGTAWTQVVSGRSDGRLVSVSAVSANDVWAVGLRSSAGAGDRTFIEHWDGSAWSQVRDANPVGFNSELRGVSAISTTDVWAVGQLQKKNGGHNSPLIEHWDGSSWRLVESNVPIGVLSGVSALSDSDAWTAGETDARKGFRHRALAEHWDGASWSPGSTPPAGLSTHFYGVSALSSDDVWAVGEDQPDTLIAHWDGTGWTTF
jgi:hypothetical protein